MTEPDCTECRNHRGVIGMVSLAAVCARDVNVGVLYVGISAPSVCAREGWFRPVEPKGGEGWNG